MRLPHVHQRPRRHRLYGHGKTITCSSPVSWVVFAAVLGAAVLASLWTAIRAQLKRREPLFRHGLRATMLSWRC